jgi:hypothetical protein
MKAVSEGAAFCIAFGVMQATGPPIGAISFCVKAERADSALLNGLKHDNMAQSARGSGGRRFAEHQFTQR